MSKRLALILVVVCACVALPVASALSSPQPKAKAAASHSFVVGIAEQHPDFFSDQRFLDLGIKNVRAFVPWDVLTNKGQTEFFDKYMKDANNLGINVLITFTQSRNPGKHSVNPTPAQLASSLKKMRQKWPWVNQFATWNEVNLEKKDPAKVAKQYLALVKACPKCTILGAELVDRAPANSQASVKKAAVEKDISTWIKGFLKATKGKQPKAWGLHNYDDANLSHTYGTQAMLKAVKGKVWFTETGGLVSRKSGSKIKLPEGQAHATAAVKYVLTKLATLSPRIDHVYLYEWTDSTATWDSAFTGPKNETRSSLVYLTQFLKGRR